MSRSSRQQAEKPGDLSTTAVPRPRRTRGTGKLNYIAGVRDRGKDLEPERALHGVYRYVMSSSRFMPSSTDLVGGSKVHLAVILQMRLIWSVVLMLQSRDGARPLVCISETKQELPK